MVGPSPPMNRALREVDLDPCLMRISKRIPQITRNPPVRRWIRWTADSPYTGSAVGLEITAASVAASDAADYGTTAARFAKIRILEARGWFTITTVPATGLQSSLQVYDPATNFEITDTPVLNVAPAAIGWRAPLQSKLSWLDVTSTASVVRFGVGANEGSVGIITVDVLAEFC